MTITGTASPVPTAIAVAPQTQQSATGFWALFANPQTPEPTPDPNAKATGPVGFWALFANSQTPETTPGPSTSATGPVGFWALFANPPSPQPAPDPSASLAGPTGFEALFGNDSTAPTTSVNAGDPTAAAASQLVEQFGQASQQQFLNNIVEKKHDPSFI